MLSFGFPLEKTTLFLVDLRRHSGGILAVLALENELSPARDAISLFLSSIFRRNLGVSWPSFSGYFLAFCSSKYRTIF